MKRSVKNLIMIPIAVLMLGLIVGTEFYGVKHISASGLPRQERRVPQMGGEMPMEQPGEMPEMNDGAEEPYGNTAPEKNSQLEDDLKSEDGSEPGSDSKSRKKDTAAEKSLTEITDEAAVMEAKTKTQRQPEENIQPMMPGGISNNTPATGVKSPVEYDLVFAAESAGFALIMIYLIMSGFNKKSFRHTFKNNDKVAIYVLSVIVMAGAMTLIADLILGVLLV